MNLSSKQLTPEMIKVLSLGLGFVPTPSYNPFRTRVDIFKLCRNIKLKKLFGAGDATTNPFKKPPTFVPNINDVAITVFEKLVLKDIAAMESMPTRIRHNLTKSETLCLQALADDRTLTIKPADKGGDLVLLDTAIYEQEIARQLDDTTYYKKLSRDPTTSIQSLVKIVLSEGLAQDIITKELHDSLYVEYPRIPVFYILPKIHKPGFPPRGHLIMAAQFSVLTNISCYVDSLLQPFVMRSKTF